MNLLSAKEAADKLGVDSSRIRQFILEGRLPAQKIGNSYVINEADLALVADRKPGRPKKLTLPLTQVLFYEAVERLLAEVGKEFGISFERYSSARTYKCGNWTWKDDSQRNVSIKRWQDKSHSNYEEVSGNLSEDDFKDAVREAIQQLLKKRSK